MTDFWSRTKEDTEIITNIRNKLVACLKINNPLQWNLQPFLSNFCFDYDELWKGQDDYDIEFTINRYNKYFNLNLKNRLDLMTFIVTKLPKGWPMPNTERYSK